ncbi:hypothetical protein PMZ80_002562 [Knufia obscura]|uniref:Uncharacterized protein n=1 Tax=Knufia obscura TaxID=1635080 RepID=A0ABR0RXQ0_9EURO|nr:hypothetical protein PMZ80_002562 [Knufia obscura]
MNTGPRLYDFAEFVSQPSPLRSSFGSQNSESTGLSFWDPAYTPATSPPASERGSAIRSASAVSTAVDLLSPVTLSFTKGSKLFKLKYSKVVVCKDVSGSIRCIELSDPSSLSGAFVHTFVNGRKPIPHLEQPATSTQKSLRVCFLEDQNVQVAQAVFNTQPQYTFERGSDCDKSQEAVLGVAVLFVAGVAEIVSKGRGEEAISQNLRICRSTTGALSLLFFANSQRKEKKRYYSLPVDAIDSVEPPKKSGKPVQMKLATSSELSAQLKALNILFIDGNDAKRMCTLMQAADVKITGR